MADALLIAQQGGAELWARAQAAFMSRAPRPYMRIIQAVQKSDWVGESPLSASSAFLACCVGVFNRQMLKASSLHRAPVKGLLACARDSAVSILA